jgi:hypothetical protein
MRAFSRFFRLNPAEREAFVLSLLAMSAVRVALLASSPRRLAGALEAINRRFPRGPETKPIGLRPLARCIRQGSRFSPVGTTCLSEAIAGRALLARYGHQGELRIGVVKNDGRLWAHAWLECADQVFIGNPAPSGKTYVPIVGAEGLIG